LRGGKFFCLQILLVRFDKPISLFEVGNKPAAGIHFHCDIAGAIYGTIFDVHLCRFANHVFYSNDVIFSFAKERQIEGILFLLSTINDSDEY